MWKNFSNKFTATISNVLLRNLTSKSGSKLQNSMETILREKFPAASEIRVNDISGGCGAMFEVFVVSTEFSGVPRVKQHLSISQALKNEIQDMHGIRIFTDVPK